MIEEKSTRDTARISLVGNHQAAKAQPMAMAPSRMTGRGAGRRRRGKAARTRQVNRFLRQVIRQMRITARHSGQKRTHWGLIVPDQFAEGVLVVSKQDTSDEIGITQGHEALFRCRGIPFFELPLRQKAEADQERNEAQTP